MRVFICTCVWAPPLPLESPFLSNSGRLSLVQSPDKFNTAETGLLITWQRRTHAGRMLHLKKLIFRYKKSYFSMGRRFIGAS